MSLGRALLGFIGTGTIVVGFGLGSVVLRPRWFPAAEVPMRHLIAGVLGLSGILGTGLVLGSVGWFRAIPLVLVALAVGAGSVVRLRRAAMDDPDPVADGPGWSARHPPWVMISVIVAIAIVAVRWIAELLQTMSRGFSHADELHYHLTHSALFAKTGDTWPIHFTSIGDGAAYHPAHSELLHGAGLAVLGSDFLSIFVNLGFVAMALTAAWVVGSHAGNAPAATLLVASVLSLRLVTAESGSTLNDTMAIALLLATVAFLLEATGADGDRRFVVLSGASAGLAAGTKLTVLVPVVALTIVLLLRPHRDRVTSALLYVGTAGVAGGYWYVRNLVATGNPVPALSFGPLPGPDLEFQRAVEFSVLEYLTDVAIWRDDFIPGLGRFFGPLWPLLPAFALLAGVAALGGPTWRKDRRWTLLSICGLVSLVSYLTTPTSAAGRPGEPLLFEFNLRYALPGLLLCGLAGLGHPALRRNPAGVSAVAIAVFLASNLHRSDVTRSALAVVLVGVFAVGTWLLASPARRWHHRAVTVAAGAVTVGAVLAGVVLNDRYLERRWTADLPRWSAFEAGDSASDVAVGLSGFPQSYPFFGADLSNDVVTLGDDASGDELVPFTSCDEWWDAVGRADLDVVVVLSERALAATELGEQIINAPMEWLRAAGAPVVLEGRDAVVFDAQTASPACDG